MGEQAALLVKDELLVVNQPMPWTKPPSIWPYRWQDLWNARRHGGYPPPDIHFAGEDVDQDFAARRTVGIVKERATFVLCAIPMQFGVLIKSRCRQMHPSGMSLLGQFAKTAQG